MDIKLPNELNGLSKVSDSYTEIPNEVMERAKIEESEKRYRELIYGSPVGIYTCNAEGDIEMYNETAERLWGRKPIPGTDKWCGSWKMYNPDGTLIPHDECPMARSIKDGSIVSREIIVEQPDGTRYFVIPYPQLVYDSNGKITGAINQVIDITSQVISRKKIEENEKQFRQLADSMPQIVWTARPDGHLDYYNKQWYEFTGFGGGYGIHSWISILHPDDVQCFMEAYKHSIKTGAHFQIEYRFKDQKNSGQYRWFMGRAEATRDEKGNIVKWYGTCTDIDKIKKLEERKDEFIRMASHEFKTPITTIKGYLQILLEKLKEDEEKPLSPLLIKSSLVTIDKQIIRLTRMISELLDLSRIEAGNPLQLQKESFNLNELVIDRVEDILYTNCRHTINVYHDFESTIYADKDRIGQVVINLVSNAVKYSPNADKIDVKIYQSKPNSVSVSVIDYGIGIDKNEHKKIFERFYRVEGKNEDTYPGFGIGLFLSRDVIQKHDGDIIVTSEKGKGSVFTFTLPAGDQIRNENGKSNSDLSGGR